jgi:hypothetical protein
VFAKPGWQWGTGVPDDGARDVPDVAVSASADHDGYLVCSQGSCVNGFRAADGTLSVVGGTSVGAPTFAGIVALIDQKTGSRQGNINYVLYPLAAGTTDVFHDITIGSNKVPCKVGSTDCPNGAAIGYNAGVGYDEATGLGSIDATNLANEWASVPTAPRDSEDFQLTASPTDLTITSGASGNATITLAAQNNFTGAVAFTCTVASNLTGTTCSVTPTSVTTGGTTTLTIKVPAAARSFPDDWKPQHPPAGPAGSNADSAAGRLTHTRLAAPSRRGRIPLSFFSCASRLRICPGRAFSRCTELRRGQLELSRAQPSRARTRQRKCYSARRKWQFEASR